LFVTEGISERIIRKTRDTVTGRGYKADERGIPLVRYGGLAGDIREPQRNPVTVGHYALQYARRLSAGDTTATTFFWNCADWLVENATVHGHWATLEYRFPFPQYHMTTPWRSGMAQGRALEVLTIADSLTGDRKYLDMARRLLGAFMVDIEDGGVRDTTPGGGWWYEEFADQGGMRSRVLNGMNFALFGINRYYQYTGMADSTAKLALDKGLEALEELLPSFDRNGASWYDLAGLAASDKYHGLHVRQLRQLDTITQTPLFAEYAERWARFQSLPMVVRLAIRPTALGFAIFVLNLIPAVGLVVFVRIALSRRKTRRAQHTPHH
jgi:hypothetical protein